MRGASDGTFAPLPRRRHGSADEPWRPLGEGAARAAPTAPHATPSLERHRWSGPERFWAKGPVRLALGVGLILSGVAHCAMLPLEIPHGFEIKDVEGEAEIPVDVMQAEDPGVPPPAPVEPKSEGEAQERDPAAPRATSDAGVVDASPPDAIAPRPTDAGVREALDEGGTSPANAPAPKDPQASGGAAGAVQADVINVMLVVNAEVIRKNPVGAKMGFLLRGVPQWEDFMRGTDIDPVRDTDWVLISGPSLVNTAKDIVLVHYSATEAIVDRAIDVVSEKYAGGGPFDAGVPGVKATLAHADRAERVILRPQARVLVVVPPSVAERVARQLRASRVPAHVRPGEAAYLRLVNPHHAMPEIPDTITEMRLRVVPRADEGADVFIDGDTKDADAAEHAARTVRDIVRNHNDAVVSFLTRGLLDGVDVTSEGGLVKAHVTASKEQVVSLLNLVAGFLGVQPPRSAGK